MEPRCCDGDGDGGDYGGCGGGDDDGGKMKMLIIVETASLQVYEPGATSVVAE